MATAFSAHPVFLVPRGNALTLSQWLHNVFGIEQIHQVRTRAAMPLQLVFLRTIYLRVPDTRVIIEIQEAIAPPVAINQSYSIMCMYTNNILATFNLAQAQNAPFLVSDLGGVGRALHRIRDQFGFCWSFASRNTLPDAAFPLPNPLPNLAVPRIFNAHYLLMVAHARFHEAVDWFTNRFRAVSIHQENNIIAEGRDPQLFGREILRLGPIQHPLIIEVIDTTHRANEYNQSHEMIVIYTQDFQGFMNRVTANEGVNVDGVVTAGPAAVRQEDDDVLEEHAFGRIRDPFGYYWTVQSTNEIPLAVMNVYNAFN